MWEDGAVLHMVHGGEPEHPCSNLSNETLGSAGPVSLRPLASVLVQFSMSQVCQGVSLPVGDVNHL
jgi:hypothetical protein